MGNRERIRSTIAAGLSGHPREADLDRFYKVADRLVGAIEQAAGISVEDDEIDVTKVMLRMERVGFSPDSKPMDGPNDDVRVLFQKRHTDGWFPFPHEHCHVNICFETEMDGKAVELCIELELPCKVDWPIIGQL